jgi:hypothetical protein
MRANGRPRGRGIIAAALLVSVGGLCGCAQATDNRQASPDEGQQKQESTVDEAGRAGLATLKDLAAGNDFRMLGLASASEAESATLGQKYEVFTIGLSPLREYRAGTNASGLLTASPDTVFPVVVNGQVRSSMTVTRTDRGFVASEIGGAGSMLATARAAERTPGDFLVRVPALGLQFVGRRVDDRVMLRLTTPDPRLKIQPGTELPAETVLEQLAPVARAYNGEPM